LKIEKIKQSSIQAIVNPLKSRLPSLWTHSYYVGTAGEVSAETIRKYIEAQEGV